MNVEPNLVLMSDTFKKKAKILQSEKSKLALPLVCSEMQSHSIYHMRHLKNRHFIVKKTTGQKNLPNAYIFYNNELISY